jgi:hypothetical protein
MDDIPLLLTSDKAEAITFAKNVKEDDGKEEMKICGDASTPISACVYHFSAAGKLTKVQVVQDFTE